MKNKYFIIIGIVIVLSVWGFYSLRVYNTPGLSYVVLDKGRGYETREYGAYSILETRVSSSYGEALDEGYGRLLGYMNGDNSLGEIIPLTRPLIVDREDAQERNILAEEIDAQETYRIIFIMPENRTLDSLPLPNDPRVDIRIVPPHSVVTKKTTCLWGRCLSEKSQGSFVKKESEKGHDGRNVLYAINKRPWGMPFIASNELWLVE